MEYPLTTAPASKAEDTRKQNGAIPATIVIFNGVIDVGLSQEEFKEISLQKKAILLNAERDKFLMLYYKRKMESNSSSLNVYLKEFLFTTVMIHIRRLI